MDHSDVKRIILEDCNDDFYGLYIIIWSLNTEFLKLKSF